MVLNLTTCGDAAAEEAHLLQRGLGADLDGAGRVKHAGAELQGGPCGPWTTLCLAQPKPIHVGYTGELIVYTLGRPSGIATRERPTVHVITYSPPYGAGAGVQPSRSDRAQPAQGAATHETSSPRRQNDGKTQTLTH